MLGCEYIPLHERYTHNHEGLELYQLEAKILIIKSFAVFSCEYIPLQDDWLLLRIEIHHIGRHLKIRQSKNRYNDGFLAQHIYLFYITAWYTFGSLHKLSSYLAVEVDWVKITHQNRSEFINLIYVGTFH